MGRMAECAVLDKDIRRRAVPLELRIVVRPSALSALYDNTIVVNGNIDVANSETAAFVDVDRVRRRTLKLFALRV